MFHWIPVEQPSGIPWASLCLKSSPCFSRGSNEVSFWVSCWPTTFHPAECPPAASISLRAQVYSAVFSSVPWDICHRTVTAQLKFTLSFLLPYSLSKRAFGLSAIKIFPPSLLFPRRKHQWLRKNLHFLQLKFNRYLLNTYDMLSFVMPSRGLWCGWWNGTDACKTIWKQQSTVMSVLSFGAKMCGPITPPLILAREADMPEDLCTSRLNFIISLWAGYNHPHFSYR